MFFQALGIAAGAGFASALLFALSAKGTILAAVLTGLAPFPIMAAALGYTHWTGLLAAILGGLTLSVALPSAMAIGYFIALALPSWHLARLAGTPRVDGGWTPPASIAAWAVGLSAAVAFGWAMMMARAGGGDFDVAVDTIAAKLAPQIEALVGPANLPKGVSAQDVAAALLRATPIAAAGSTTLMLLGNLWLAGRATAISGLLLRPRIDAPRDFGLPRPALGALALGLLLAFADGLVGLVGWIVAAATFTGFVLQGLATAHFLTRDWPQRRTALVALYVVLVVISWSGALIGLFGVADALFGLRARKSASQPRN